MDQDLFVPELVMGPAKRAAYDPPPVRRFLSGRSRAWDHGTMGIEQQRWVYTGEMRLQQKTSSN